MEDEQPAPRGNIGNEIFDQVEKIMAEEGLSRTQAFQRLSETHGPPRRHGRGELLPGRAPARRRAAAARAARLRAAAAPAQRGRAGAPGDVDAALARAMEAMQELAAARAQPAARARLTARAGGCHRPDCGRLASKADSITRGITGCLAPRDAAAARRATSSSPIGSPSTSAIGERRGREHRERRAQRVRRVVI